MQIKNLPLACFTVFVSAIVLLAPLEGGVCGRIFNRITSFLHPADADIDINAGVNETFTIELEQALHPGYEWKCTEYDKEYVELVDEGFKASSDPDLMGKTIKYFTFKALKKGTTELKFAYGSVGAEGTLKEITEEESYTVRISG
ncbi:MAG: protease inhibitor I42 family protein [Candidatus Thermoplasmatota archaeon]|nr:protease inhibitor I42 family protein [Candidatus Thermoplasmatota archaeon]